jgi:hypothetical protein
LVAAKRYVITWPTLDTRVGLTDLAKVMLGPSTACAFNSGGDDADSVGPGTAASSPARAAARESEFAGSSIGEGMTEGDADPDSDGDDSAAGVDSDRSGEPSAEGDSLGVAVASGVALGPGDAVAAGFGVGVGVGSAEATRGAPISPTTSAAAASPVNGRGENGADMDGSWQDDGDSPAEIPQPDARARYQRFTASS